MVRLYYYWIGERLENEKKYLMVVWIGIYDYLLVIDFDYFVF